MLIDTHCHLYSEDFLPDIAAVIEHAERESVKKFYLPAIDSSTHGAMMELEEKFPGRCFAMIGLHPCSVKEDYEKELAAISQLLLERNFAGIGETGLDFYWDKTFVKEQYLALETQAEWALEYKLPLILHTRNAMDETIEAVKPFAARGLRGIFHCFGGTIEQARQITAAGFLLGIGGVVTYKNAGLDKVLDKVDIQHLVLETDAPYLSPVPFRGKRNESQYLGLVAKKIAAIKNMSLEEVAAATTASAEQIFNSMG